MKHGTPDHPKTFHLALGGQMPPYAAVGVLESLWHFTAAFCPAGDIGKFSNDAIARKIGWDRKADELIDALCDAKWIDKDEASRYIVHDWPEHCDDWVHAKLARERKFFADGSIPKWRKLSEHERKEAEKWYSENDPSKAAKGRLRPPKAAGGDLKPHKKRCLALPCQASPSQDSPSDKPTVRSEDQQKRDAIWDCAARLFFNGQVPAPDRTKVGKLVNLVLECGDGPRDLERAYATIIRENRNSRATVTTVLARYTISRSPNDDPYAHFTGPTDHSAIPVEQRATPEALAAFRAKIREVAESKK